MHYVSCFSDQIPEKKQLKGGRPYFVFEGRAHHGGGGADMTVVRDRDRETYTENHRDRDRNRKRHRETDIGERE